MENEINEKIVKRVQWICERDVKKMEKNHENCVEMER